MRILLISLLILRNKVLFTTNLYLKTIQGLFKMAKKKDSNPHLTGDALFNQANQLFGSNPEGAIELYSSAIENNPRYIECAYHNRGLCHASQGNLGEALSDYELALAHNNNYAEAYTNKAAALAQLGRYPEAIGTAAQALLSYQMASTPTEKAMLGAINYKDKLVNDWHKKAEKLRDAGKDDAAEREYSTMLLLNRGDERAETALDSLNEKKQSWIEVAEEVAGSVATLQISTDSRVAAAQTLGRVTAREEAPARSNSK